MKPMDGTMLQMSGRGERLTDNALGSGETGSHGSVRHDAAQEDRMDEATKMPCHHLSCDDVSEIIIERNKLRQANEALLATLGLAEEEIQYAVSRFDAANAQTQVASDLAVVLRYIRAAKAKA